MPLTYFVLVGLALYGLGFVALLLRRNALFVVLGVFIQMAGSGLVFASASRAFADIRGQGVAFILIAVGMTHAVVALAAFTGLHRQQRAPHLDAARRLRG